MDIKPKVYCYIRFSTAEQEEGDSFRRQFNNAKKYADKHGLTLDKSHTFTDLGISGYKGINRNDGELKDFIDLVDKGEIPHGSILIVEHLDRLSREKTGDALTLFLHIINKGIKIVTLQDNIEYDKDSINNQTQLILSIMLMASAHDESLKKSIRTREAFEEKRKKLRNKEIKIFSVKCPYWITLSEDKTKFVKIPEACEAIKLIFKKRLEGKGSYKIEKVLNLDPAVWKPPVSPRNKSGGWRDAYINKILRSRSVIGEFQPHEQKTERTIKNGKEEERTIRVAIGDPIKNYYPKVIDEGMFFKVQEIIKQNAKMPGNAGGGNTDKCNNLFSNVVKCGICGSSMQYVNRGKNVWTYLVCDSVKRKNIVPIRIKPDEKQINAKIAAKLSRRKIKIPETEVKTEEKVCTAKSVRYDEFERIFFENFEELDIGTLIPDEDETTKLKKEKENKISANNFKLNDLDSQINNLITFISKTEDEENQKMYDQRVTEKRSAKDKLLAENKNLEQEIKDLVEQRQRLKKHKDNIKEVYSFLESAKDEQERIDRRFQLRQEIKNMIEWIKIYTLQEEYKEHEEIEPGIVQFMKSKTIDRIRIKFKGSKTLLRIIYLKSSGEIIE